MSENLSTAEDGHPYSLFLTLDRTGNHRSIQGAFSAQEWGKLMAYCSEVDRLIEVVKKFDTKQISFNMSVTRYSTTVDPTAFTPLELAALLHALRPLILKEPNSFMNTCSLIGRHFTDGWMRRCTQWLRHHYENRPFQAKFSIKLGSTIVDFERTFYDWINGFEYHRDQEKRQAIETLTSAFPVGLTDGLFSGMLMSKVGAICDLRHLINTIHKANGEEFGIIVATKGQNSIERDANDPEKVVLRAMPTESLK